MPYAFVENNHPRDEALDVHRNVSGALSERGRAERTQSVFRAREAERAQEGARPKGPCRRWLRRRPRRDSHALGGTACRPRSLDTRVESVICEKRITAETMVQNVIQDSCTRLPSSASARTTSSEKYVGKGDATPSRPRTLPTVPPRTNGAAAKGSRCRTRGRRSSDRAQNESARARRDRARRSARSETRSSAGEAHGAPRN